MSKPLNIWTIYQFASTPKIPGSERTFQFAKAFAGEGHNVTLWTSSYSHWGKVETILDDNRPCDKDNEEGVNIVSLKTKPIYHKNDYRRFINMIYFAYAFIKVSRSVTPRPDVIIASYPSPFAAVAAYLLSLKYGAKFILEIRDLWPQNWIERKAYSRYHPFIMLLSFIEKYLYSRTQYFVTVLPYVGQYLEEKGMRPRKVLWIPNGIHIEEFRQTATQTTKDENVKKILDTMVNVRDRGDLNVIYVGGIGVGNRVDYIVKSAHQLKKEGINGISFTIIGEGHSKEELKKYALDHALDSVYFYDAIPRRSVPLVLSKADIGILCLNDNPIYRYGVNLHKVYDYMAAGLPIIFSANVRNNLVEDAGAGITVPPGDVPQIVSALKSIISMPEKDRIAMGQRGFVYLSENYDINRKLTGRYMEIIIS